MQPIATDLRHLDGLAWQGYVTKRGTKFLLKSRDESSRDKDTTERRIVNAGAKLVVPFRPDPRLPARGSGLGSLRRKNSRVRPSRLLRDRRKTEDEPLSSRASPGRGSRRRDLSLLSGNARGRIDSSRYSASTTQRPSITASRCINVTPRNSFLPRVVAAARISLIPAFPAGKPLRVSNPACRNLMARWHGPASRNTQPLFLKARHMGSIRYSHPSRQRQSAVMKVRQQLWFDQCLTNCLFHGISDKSVRILVSSQRR